MNALITLNDNYDATGTLTIQLYRADGSNSSTENKTIHLSEDVGGFDQDDVIYVLAEHGYEFHCTTQNGDHYHGEISKCTK